MSKRMSMKNVILVSSAVGAVVAAIIGLTFFIKD